MKGIIVDITTKKCEKLVIETKPRKVITVNLKHRSRQPERFILPEDTQVVTIKAYTFWKSVGRILASFSNGYVTDESWSCANSFSCKNSSDDCPSLKWNNATTFGKNDESSTTSRKYHIEIASNAQWIWISYSSATSVWCKRTFSKFKCMCKIF